MSNSPTILWFRQDLRLHGNPALSAAISRGRPVIPVYIWSPEEEGNWPPGAASRWWLHQSLRSLKKSLQEMSSDLILLVGNTQSQLKDLIKQTGADAVYWNRRCEPSARQLDSDVEVEMHAAAIETQLFDGQTLFEMDKIKNSEGNPFQVFTPFWKACVQFLEKEPPDETWKVFPASPYKPTSKAVEDLNLLPTHNWTNGLSEVWQPGESGAREQLQQFLKESIQSYTEERDRPDLAGVSRMSPHLHFGEIGPRQIFREVLQIIDELPSLDEQKSAWGYLRQLGWREFSSYLLYHFPHTQNAPLRPLYESFPYIKDRAMLKAWQHGLTGYPIVDAGMRQLWQTGWMHNRVRLITASFLVKDLLISWKSGTLWFWDTLVDADLANNTMGWQWTAGCGADASPYFRIFNPVKQGEKFDPTGEYVRRWVPELGQFPDNLIHRPWEASLFEQMEAGTVLGEDYPHRIVDHDFARERALSALSEIKNTRPEFDSFK